MASSEKNNSNGKPLVTIMVIIGIIILILLLLKQCGSWQIPGSDPTTKESLSIDWKTITIDGPSEKKPEDDTPLANNVFYFRPNLSDQFAPETKLSALDDLAKELLAKNLGKSDEIDIQGYVAFAHNDVDPRKLSRERGEFIIEELKKRNIDKSLFTKDNPFFTAPKEREPIDKPEDNTPEEQRKKYRRVEVKITRKNATEYATQISIVVPIFTTTTVPDKPGKPGETFDLRPIINWLLVLLIAAFVILGILYLILKRNSQEGDGDSGKRDAGKKEKLPTDAGKMDLQNSMKDQKQEWIPPTPTDKNHEYRGGYYGEIPEIPGKTTAHHIPSNMAINKAFGFTGMNQDGEKEGMVNGWTPAVEMDYEDHEFTTSYKYSAEGKEFQEKQVALIQEGKFMEALKMDIDDVLRIQKLRGLGNKYNKGLYEAVHYMYRLLTISDDDLQSQLPDYAKHPMLLKSRSNPVNKVLAEQILRELGYD